MRKYITTKWLKEISACEDAIDEREKYFGKHTTTIHEELDWHIKTKNYDWGCWILPRLMNRLQRIQFAVFAARLALPNIKEASHRRLVSNLINAVEKYGKSPTIRNKKLMKNAYYSAKNAYYSAKNAYYSAYYNAYYSAKNAYYSAYYSAYSAYYSAYSAYYSASNASNAKILKICFDCGRKLLFAESCGNDKGGINGEL